MTAIDFLALANSAIQRLQAYDPGHDLPLLRQRFAHGELVELGSNENEFGASLAALAAYAQAANELHRYPDPNGRALKAALAEKYALRPEQITLGNGSHELLMLIAQCFGASGREIVFSQYGFAVFAIASQASGATARVGPALARSSSMPFGHDLDAIAACVGPATCLVYLANPNNPTGTWFGQAALDAFMARIPPQVIVVMDEAYAEYANGEDVGSGLNLLPRYPNLLVTRTFSKAYGLAGMRLGYALSHAGLAAVLERLRESFNANGPALAAATAALADATHAESVRRHNAEERQWIAGRLRERGLQVLPSQTNFLLVDFATNAKPIEDALLAQGVVVRPMGGYGLPTCLRISIGRRKHSQRLLDALNA